MKRDFLKVKTPGKLILSGEHAVVHGYPALAVAVNRYTEVTVRWASPLHFSFNLAGIDFKRQITLHALRKLKNKLKKQYHQYKSGHISIREVLQKPFELSLYTFINIIDRLKNKLPMGIDIVTDSNIPMGCGMGSSAANVVSLIYSLTQFLDIEFSLDDYIHYGIESENLQHGRSSGLDVHTVYHGGCLRYEKGIYESRIVPEFPMQLVQTGEPLSSTGECVAETARYFKDGGLGSEFTAVTHALDDALQNGKMDRIKSCIQQNHKLLRTIGVVPNKINDFITHVENRGGAAKICGAGSIQGDQGGVVLIVSEPGDDFSDLVKDFHYQTLPIQMDNRGTHVI